MRPLPKRADDGREPALLRESGNVSADPNERFGAAFEQKVVLDISTENAAIARRVYSLLKKYYQVHIELLVRKKCV